MSRRVFVDHLTLRVADMAASRAFYARALEPLGARGAELAGGEVVFGPRGSEDFAIAPGGPVEPVHLAFAAGSREQVEEFWRQALAAGGTDNGKPGPRPVYHAGYYAGYVLDPDGHNVEAVFHADGEPAVVRPVADADRAALLGRVRAVWNSPAVYAHGVAMHPGELPGFLAESAGRLVGSVTYVVRGEAAEIVTLEAHPRHTGTGTALLEAAAEAARAAGCRRLVLTTTNDNLEALRFYQRRGFRLTGVRPGAVDDTRRLHKPQIPAVGNDGIPLRDELELVREL